MTTIQITVPSEKDMYVMFFYRVKLIRTWQPMSNMFFLSFQITVTPLGVLSHAEIDCQAYFKELLPGVTECFSSSAL